MQNDVPEFDRFDVDDAWHLGAGLVGRCRGQSLPVTIDIRLGEQRVFHAALRGTSADNDGWVDRKSRVVQRFGVSSLEVDQRLVRGDPTGFLTGFALSPNDYAPTGGAVPIRVRGSLVGVLTVSGLKSEEDHDLAVSALRAAAGGDHQSGLGGGA